jgi:hypothetical protein
MMLGRWGNPDCVAYVTQLQQHSPPHPTPPPHHPLLCRRGNLELGAYVDQLQHDSPPQL